MSVVTSSLKISDPEYFHREYKNDLPQEEPENFYLHQCKRVTLVALPFLSLYKPLSFPLAVGLGGMRTITSFTGLICAAQNGNASDCAYALLQTTIAIIALAGTLLAHPLGMLITTVHDCALDVFALGQNLLAGEYQAAFNSTGSLINNMLYLALFTHGGLEIAIASLSMQILMGLANSIGEYQKGNYLEAGGHFLMGMIRGHQLAGRIELLQFKWELEKSQKKSKALLNSGKVNSESEKNSSCDLILNKQNYESNPELVDVLSKYGKGPYPGFPVTNAAYFGDEAAVRLLIKNNFGFELGGNNTYPSALNIAINKRHDAVAKLLINAGHPLDEVGGGGGRVAPIFCAICTENTLMLRYLLEHGANSNVKCPPGYRFFIVNKMKQKQYPDTWSHQTPLACICSVDSFNDSEFEKYKKLVIDILLEHGAKI